MGLRDRDYIQENHSDSKKRRQRRPSERSITGTLILINFALWFANGLLFANNSLSDLLMLRMEYTNYLTSCYRYLTYGFVHDPSNWWHIVSNMLGLLMFGYGMMLGIGPHGFGLVRGENVESRLGKREFAAFYLMTILMGGFMFALLHYKIQNAVCLGASGGVCGVVILYAWMFPRKTLLLWGILPMPMWAIGVFLVLMDAMGAVGLTGGRVAYSVHLTGAAFATLYYFLFYKAGIKMTDRTDSYSRSKRKTTLHIHSPGDSPTDFSTADEEFRHRLDEILKRYGEVGESGLTSEEREFLQRASRRFSDKNRNQ